MMNVSARRGTVPFCGYTAHGADHLLPISKSPLLKRLTHYIYVLRMFPFSSARL